MLAGSAIGAGLMISGGAMAAAGDPAPADQLTMVSVGRDGDAIQCTFDGPDVEGLLPDLPAGISVDDGVIVGSGQLIPADAKLLDGVSALPGSVTVVAGAVPIDAQGRPALPDANVFSAQVLSAADAREGTAEECSAMHDQAAEMASRVAAGGVQVLNGRAPVTSIAR